MLPHYQRSGLLVSMILVPLLMLATGAWRELLVLSAIVGAVLLIAKCRG